MRRERWLPASTTTHWRALKDKPAIGGRRACLSKRADGGDASAPSMIVAEQRLRVIRVNGGQPFGALEMRLLILIILIVLLVGALPSWPYSAGWGYYPSGGLGTILIIVLVLALLGII